METLPKKQFKLPELSDLINSDMLQLDEINQLNILLNQKPPKNWLKTHPMVTKDVYDNEGKKHRVPIEYIPIERVEYLLTKIFFRWKVEIKNIQLIGNSVCCEIRLHYFNPVSDEWEWQDGVGAVALQTDKEAGAIDFNKLKSNAVMIAAPAAKSYAVKDAAQQIGAIFGKNLNRPDQMNYDLLDSNSSLKNKPEKYPELLED